MALGISRKISIGVEAGPQAAGQGLRPPLRFVPCSPDSTGHTAGLISDCRK